MSRVRRDSIFENDRRWVVDGELVMAVSTHKPEAAASERSDGELVAAALRDPSAFLALYERYFPRVERYVRIRIAERATCEDVTSEVFIAALAGLEGFRGSGSFAAWLFRIAQNAVHSHYRVRPSVPLDDEELAAVAASGPDPQQEALRNERVCHLRRVLAELKPEQQSLLALRYGAELGSGEIGEVLGKSPVAARVALHRAVRDLRRRYFDEGR
jgi:RNA polymerase sigma-70 factor, ECF subfamily